MAKLVAVPAAKQIKISRMQENQSEAATDFSNSIQQENSAEIEYQTKSLPVVLQSPFVIEQISDNYSEIVCTTFSVILLQTAEKELGK